MNKIKYNSMLVQYLRLPLYLIPVFILGIILLFLHNHYKIGYTLIGALVLYTTLVIVLYVIIKRSIDNSVLDFAMGYASVQKSILENLDVPYALITADGKFLWMNKEFEKTTGKDKSYQKSITTIFPQITKEKIANVGEGKRDLLSLEFEEMSYKVTVHRFEAETMKKGDMLGFAEGQNTVYAIILYDETKLMALQTQQKETEMVAALVYVDNYEEIADSVDSVRLSVIRAVIERKVYQYFQGKKALVRRTDRDKYIVVTDRKGLSLMEEDNFAILEQIKTTKVTNDTTPTLSIGIGVAAEDYYQNLEYARAAIDMALGRGGSQAVLKDGDEISYYGAHGKEKEKTTRVKARVKAQALRELMQTRDDIIIMGHAISDIDAFGAAVGIYCAANSLGKTAHIVLNDISSSLRPIVDTFSKENGYPENLILDSTSALVLQDDNTLVVVVDTNRPSYTECPKLIERSESIVVFDHHRSSKETIENTLLSYIEPYASSTCEMVAEMLPYFSDKIELKTQEADALYAGILIDTNNFMTKTGVRTFEAAAYLRRNGAEVTRVRKLLREDMNAYKAKAEIVRHASVYKDAFAISEYSGENTQSPTIVGAQAANELLNIVGIKASFVLTEYNDKIYVSSRSIDEIDVQHIMEKLGGGGHLNIAGAQIKDASLDEVKKMITDVIDEFIEEGKIEKKT